MARDRLHIICGNCGCNDEFNVKVFTAEEDGDITQDAFITCENCSTVHSLLYFIERQNNRRAV